MDIRDSWVDGKQNVGQIVGDTSKSGGNNQNMNLKTKNFPWTKPKISKFRPRDGPG